MPASDVLRRDRTKSPLAGSPASFDSQGLEMPPEVVALISGLLMPPVMQGMGQFAGQLPKQVQGLSEAGAIFPEGMSLPKDKTLLQELGHLMTPSRQNYLRNQMLSDWHAQNFDFPAVLRDKWAMLMHSGGN